MRAFKHLRAEHAELALRIGQFRIARISDFHEMEGPLADELDGSYEFLLENFELDTSRPDEYHRATTALQQVMRFEGEGITRLTGMRLLMPTADYWALCLATIPTGSAASVYESLLEIVDARYLAAALCRSHPTELGDFMIREVEYKSRQFNPMDGPVESNPFIKDLRFQSEHELRIIWQAKTNRREPIITASLEATRYLKRLK